MEYAIMKPENGCTSKKPTPQLSPTEVAQSWKALSASAFERMYIKADQAARAKAGQERLAKVRCKIISTNIGLKIPESAAPKEPMLPSVTGSAFGPPPVVMYVSMPVMMTIHTQINAPIVKPSSACLRLLRTL